MFLVIPYKADAPVDHRPWGTIALIVCNVALTIVLGFPVPTSPWGPPAEAPFVNSLTLKFGTLNPLTWITCAFVHVGWLHLIFNMAFLWSFGLVVEGLIGWRRFVPLYLAIGAIVSMLVQLMMLGAERGQAAGASGAICGIMTVAALWAPRNEFSTFVWILVFIRFVEAQVLTLTGVFVFLDLLFAVLRGFSMSSEVAHLLGAGTGIAFGTVMLRKGWVDTGGWDWFSLRRGREVVIPAGPGTVPKATPGAADLLAAIRDDLEAGKAIAADARYEGARKARPGFALPHDDFLRLVEALARSNAPDAAVERMEEYLRTYPEGPVRLALARLLMQSKRPQRALDHLAALVPASDAQREAKAALEAEARGALGASGLELE